MSCNGGSHDCNFTTALSVAGKFWMTDVRPVGVETILVIDNVGARMLSTGHGHVSWA